MLLALLALIQSPTIDGDVWWDGVFHDPSPVWCTPLEPDAGETVRLRLRAWAGDLTGVTLRLWDEGLQGGAGGEVRIPMTVERTAGPLHQFEVWAADYTLGSSTVWYRFLLEDLPDQDVYVPRGMIDQWNGERDFQIRPGFRGPSWARGAVGYQIFPDRFRNGDSSNDPADGEWDFPFPGQPIVFHNDWNAAPQNSSDFFGGDLEGIRQARSYLSAIGVEYLYLNPIFESRSNHRYGAVRYDRVDPRLGSQAELARLVRELQEDDIRIVLDLVLNHCSSWSLWFDRYNSFSSLGAHENPTASSYGDWFTFLAGFDPITNPEAYCSWFSINLLPKLDFGNPTVRDVMVRRKKSVARGWLKLGIAGWRADAAEDVGVGCQGGDHTVWEELRAGVKGDDPEALLIAEEWDDALSFLDGRQFDGVMDFRGFLFPVESYCLTKASSTSDFVATLLERSRAYSATANHSSWKQLGNHDVARALSRAGGDRYRVREATIWQFTVPGSPMIYYGDEIGTLGGADPDNRRTFRWKKASWDRELVELTARLAQLRRLSPALREGSFDPWHSDDNARVAAFVREHLQETVLVVLSDASGGQDYSLNVERYFADGTTLEDLLTGATGVVSQGTLSLSGPLHLEGHSGRVFVPR